MGTFALFALLPAAGALLWAPSALADPHAVFYTAKGQEQVFYNVLAALNQADYVEPPTTSGPGSIFAARAQGDAIRDGQPTDALGNPAGIKGYPEPNERVELPRIRVRAVTSDSGDVYYRELVYRKALSEKIRGEFGDFSCEVQRQIYGDEVWEICRNKATGSAGQSGGT